MKLRKVAWKLVQRSTSSIKNENRITLFFKSKKGHK